MSSKEVQLSLSFCGALAAILLISAPINEMTALYSSGFSFLIAAGFFYKGITTYFAEKETQTLNAAQQSELTLKEFENQFIQYQNAVNSQLQNVIKAIENLDDTLNDSIAKPLQDVTETVSTMSASVNLIKNGTENIESNTGKIKNLTKTADDISDEIEDLTKNVDALSKNIAEVPQVNETLKELMRTMIQQEDFYMTMLNQHKNMTAKDADIIENLARRLR